MKVARACYPFARLRYIGLLALLYASMLAAGPPYQTDDTDVALYKQWEVYLYGEMTKNSPFNFIQVPALEVDYGILPNVEMSLVVPMAMILQNTTGGNAIGFGDMELGLEYRFIQETSNTPAVAIAPDVIFTTGSATRGLGNGQISYELPVWVQKTIGSWVIDTGAGYEFNNGSGLLSYPFGGLLVQRALNNTITLGLEIYTQGASAINIGSFVDVNGGFTYNFTPNFSLLCSAGHSIAGAQAVVGYIGLYWQTAATHDYHPDLR